MAQKPIRVLIIDDSAYNRKKIAEFLNAVDNVEVVGKALDGQEGLQMVHNLRPDVITLDLEMPRMDGFAFLRLLMISNPTPVIVISSHSKKANVFQALELGAVDFVAKPSHRISPEIETIKEDVIDKVLLASNLTPNTIRRLSTYSVPAASDEGAVFDFRRIPHAEGGQARKVAVIGASTGGPATLTGILSALQSNLDLAVVVAQHMPPGFTTSFAERLDVKCPFSVVEPYEPDLLRRGVVYICPGDRSLEIYEEQGAFGVKPVFPNESDRYTPSVDRLFHTAATTLGKRVLGVVLTGMGDDGAEGSASIVSNGGQVIVESSQTAVIDGMPTSVLRANVPAMSVPSGEIAWRITTFSEGK